MKHMIFWISVLIFLVFLATVTAGLERTNEGDNLAEQSSGENNELMMPLAEKKPLKPDVVMRAGIDTYYGISMEGGFLFSVDSGKTWEERNDGLPKKMTYPFQKEKVRQLTALGVDSANPERVAALTATNIYLSEDYGNTWSRIERKKPIPNGAFLTAVALSPANKNNILLGTSFAGIFETKDQGKTWTNISKDLKFLYQGADYWEEISALAYKKDNPDVILFRCGFGQGFYQLNKDRKTAQKLDFQLLNTDQVVSDLQSETTHDVRTENNQPNDPSVPNNNNQEAIRLDSEIGNQLFKNESFKPEVPEEPAKLARLRSAANKFGIYIRADIAKGKSLDDKIGFIKKNGLNAMVIDFKDDFGFLTYNTKLSLPLQMGSVRKKGINIEELLMKAKENGIYVIGRIVVFQDPQLFRYQKYKYAAWDQNSNKPWNTKEYWVDPFSKDVWAYNLAIAEELQALGIDEIQFDYIRFPTDGDIGRIVYRHRPEGAEKIDALESFLAYARERITIPISTDLYGFSCWYKANSINGQNIELIANYVDVICPMYYPSHFPRGFLPGLDYLERAWKIYHDGTSRAYSMVEGRSIVRPYVQAFRLGGELKMTAPVYTNYLLNQIKGNLATLSPGFTLWDYANNYYMVTKPLGEYLEGK